MKRSLLAAALAAPVCGLVSGCATPRASRIAEQPAIFAALSPVDQEKVRKGLIDVGFRHEHVYMALGKPSRVVTDPRRGPEVQTWVYHNFVYAPTTAAMIAPTQTGARYDGRQLSAAPVRGGVASTPRSGPTATLDDSGGGTATLLIDLVDGAVARIYLEP